MRSTHTRLAAGNRLPGEQIPPEVQLRLATLIPASGNSAYQLAYGSDPVDLFGRGADGEDLPFTKDTSPSAHFTRQWKFCVMAQGAALRGAA